ncbi:L-ascorbate metabolism protein UlaG, beta-lactamase superfamily [Caloranaerobacter azorensis DSM 13643]|uniref:L-ascorbate metabolism protein UlaG, beta-lactamase superfamily n=1 Tax=Caloranaerobacter azorensis DSM 13643 TaxID=1121264 RepID=A0A1M5STJ0_9FIRM|nr:MBL fold metallo-hydrolase [Caloranaerobacter azorensis]SHH41767.1 L-ascorbate metabolism protein UlaG, beta-lactamase superfamily [Caloranaerobacter azorensis DSM 13643]
MKVKYLGHACFKITTNKGIRIMTDPFDETVGYEIPRDEVDIVTTSHDHFDHNYIKGPTGDFEVVNKVGNFYVKDVPITGIATYHDKHQGSERGSNVVYIFTIGDLRVCHLGDLGHIPDSKQIEAIGKVDVLMIPVGGVYTIDADEAKEVVDLINPKIVIPMHYKTEHLKFELGSLDKFTKYFSNVEKVNSQEIEINKDVISNAEKKVIVLRYK